MYGGWNDSPIAPGLPVDYYKSVLEKMGDSARLRESVRLFMVPDMNECVGSNGYTFDPLALVHQWKTTGTAPQSTVVSHLTAGMQDRTMLVCPYPQLARCKGTGDTKDAANFACR